MSNMWYILDEAGNPVAEPNPLKAADFLYGPDREARCRVAYTEFPYGSLSTVFLGLDYNHFGNGPPILFESLWFRKDGKDGEMRRYCTKDEALAGHQFLLIKESKNQENP